MLKLTRRRCLTSTALGAILPKASPSRAQAPQAAPLEAPALMQTEPAVADRPLFGAVTWQLGSGQTVVLAEQRRAPVVAHYLFVDAGGGEDPAGRSGTAHFLEHMMFKGSLNVAPGAFSLIVAREGGQYNAFVSRNVTAYHQNIEASRLPLVMRLEADRFAHPLLPPEALEPERLVILEERRQRIDANPRGRFSEALEAALWGRQHWHGRPVIGWEEEIRAITRDDLVDFHARRYAPANAVLVVGGDAREAELRQLAEEFYGVIPAREPLRRHRAPPPDSAVEPRFEMRDPALHKASLARQIIAPGLLAGESRHAYPLTVLAHLLGTGPGSRLNRTLVQSGLATSVSVSYSGDVPSFTTFTLAVTAHQGIEPARLEAALDAEIARLLQDGVTEEEVRRSIRQLTAGVVLALDGLGAVPRLLGNALACGLPLDAVEFWPRHIRAVTAAQVTEAAHAVLAAAPSTIGWHLPA